MEDEPREPFTLDDEFTEDERAEIRRRYGTWTSAPTVKLSDLRKFRNFLDPDVSEHDTDTEE